MWQREVLTQPVAIKVATDWARKKEAVSFFDAGDVQANGFQIVQDDRLGRTFTDTGASFMGFAVSALLATAVTSKSFYGLAISGDGSFTMNPQILIDGVEHGAQGCLLLLDNRRITVRKRQGHAGVALVGHFEPDVTMDRRGQQTGLFLAAKGTDDGVLVVERVEPIRPFGSHLDEPGWYDAHTSSAAGKLAIVALWPDLIAHEEDQPTTATQVCVQHTRFAGRKLGHIAQEDAIVSAKVQLQQRAFRKYLRPDQRAIDVGLGR